MLNRSRKRAASVFITMLASLFGGVAMVQRGAVRPGWLMIVVSTIGCLVMGWRLARRPTIKKEENNA